MHVNHCYLLENVYEYEHLHAICEETMSDNQGILWNESQRKERDSGSGISSTLQLAQKNRKAIHTE